MAGGEGRRARENRRWGHRALEPAQSKAAVSLPAASQGGGIFASTFSSDRCWQLRGWGLGGSRAPEKTWCIKISHYVTPRVRGPRAQGSFPSHLVGRWRSGCRRISGRAVGSKSLLQPLRCGEPSKVSLNVKIKMDRSPPHPHNHWAATGIWMNDEWRMAFQVVGCPSSCSLPFCPSFPYV